MSQNVTLSTTILPAQWLALQALVSGGSITKAATEAGVACETAIAAPVPMEAHGTEAGGGGEVMEQATETTQHAASVAVASAAHEPVDDPLDEGGKVREAVITRFRQSVSDRVSQSVGTAV